VNTSDLPQVWLRAERRVLEIQTKLHRWANDDPHRRFDDLYNLVTDPGVLLMAWDRVAGNKVHARLESTGKPPPSSRNGSAWRTSSPNCGSS
jgi:retron-type reverse transcriptase